MTTFRQWLIQVADTLIFTDLFTDEVKESLDLTKDNIASTCVDYETDLALLEQDFLNNQNAKIPLSLMAKYAQYFAFLDGLTEEQGNTLQVNMNTVMSLRGLL